MALPKKAAPKQEQQLVPLNQFSHGTGLLHDVDITITDIGFDPAWNYQGHRTEEVLALVVEMTDEQGNPWVQGYSLGKTGNDNFAVTDDAGGLVGKKEKALINDNSNGFLFLSSLLEAGLPGEMLEGGYVKGLIGLRCHVFQQPQPKRTGLVREGERESTVLLVTEIHELPDGGGKKAAPAKAAPARPTPGKPAAKPAGNPSASRPTPAAASTAKPASPSKPNGSAPAPQLEEVAADIVLTLLSREEGGQADKAALMSKIFEEAQVRVEKKEIQLKQKTAVAGLAFKDEFLHSLVEQNAITYEDGVLTLVQ